MKKLFMVLAATLICGACLFTSCKKDDLNLEEKIIGKWIMADEDGQPMPTNMKAVYTFISTTKAYVSVSLNNNQDMSELWDAQTEKSVVIDGTTFQQGVHWQRAID